MTEQSDFEKQVKEFLEGKPQSEYWRVIEIINELHSDDILGTKAYLERGVDKGIYERKIVYIKKIVQVGYRCRRTHTDDSTITKAAVDKLNDGGWEVKK